MGFLVVLTLVGPGRDRRNAVLADHKVQHMQFPVGDWRILYCTVESDPSFETTLVMEQSLCPFQEKSYPPHHVL